MCVSVVCGGCVVRVCVCVRLCVSVGGCVCVRCVYVCGLRVLCVC